MDKIKIEDKTFLVGYHTQEYREDELLENPLRCNYANAWLGVGYYFWTDIEFAKYWGEDFKKAKTGFYDIYKAEIDISKCLNITFNEEQYFFFIKCIEAVIEDLQKTQLNGNINKITLKRVNELLAEKYWNKLGITGIIYDDLPSNPISKPNRKYSIIEYSENGSTKFLYYKKRIQIVVFNIRNIRNFEIYLEEQS
jgi:hypothetical protein